MTFDAVDCQSFAGGFTLGVAQAGFRLVGKRENVGGFGMANCLANRHLLGYDWDAQASLPAEWEPRDVPFVFGNPPCSGFSLFTGDQKNRGIDAKVNECMWDFVRFAARCRPEVAVFESVPQAFKEGRPLMQALRVELENLTGERYELYHVLHNAYELGGCAIRPRYFFVVSKIPFGVDYPALSYFPTIEDAWADLDGMDLTWERQPYRRPALSAWTRRARNGQDAVDGHEIERNGNAVRVDDLLKAMKREHPGGWPARMNMYSAMRWLHENAEGSVPDSSRDQTKKYVDKDWNTGFTCPVRWPRNEPARVIVGGALALTIHPWQDRLITHREAARVMGFPDNWTINGIRKLVRGRNFSPTWGKGITVDCGRWIGGWVKTALEGTAGPLTGELIGEREHLINNPTILTRGKATLLAQGGARQVLPVVNLRDVGSLVGSTTSGSSRAGVWYGGSTTTAPRNGAATQTKEIRVARKAKDADTQTTDGAQAVATEGSENGSAGGRSGRPRPQLTLERDRLVAEKMAEFELGQEWTKDEVAEATGLPANVVLHCLNRLTWSGNVAKVGRGKFVRTAVEGTTEPTPYSSEYVAKPEKKAVAVASA